MARLEVIHMEEREKSALEAVEEYENQMVPLTGGSGYHIKSECQYVYGFDCGVDVLISALKGVLDVLEGPRYYYQESHNEKNWVIFDKATRNKLQVTLDPGSNVLVIYPFAGAVGKTLIDLVEALRKKISLDFKGMSGWKN